MKKHTQCPYRELLIFINFNEIQRCCPDHNGLYFHTLQRPRHRKTLISAWQSQIITSTRSAISALWKYFPLTTMLHPVYSSPVHGRMNETVRCHPVESRSVGRMRRRRWRGLGRVVGRTTSRIIRCLRLIVPGMQFSVSRRHSLCPLAYLVVFYSLPPNMHGNAVAIASCVVCLSLWWTSDRSARWRNSWPEIGKKVTHI